MIKKCIKQRAKKKVRKWLTEVRRIAKVALEPWDSWQVKKVEVLKAKEILSVVAQLVKSFGYSY